MDVSIIIPTFNEEQHLRSTLQSVIDFLPSSCDYEVIVVDNHSTDDSVDIARRYDATVIEHQSGTVAALRNTGVKHSRGQILLFLDADVSLTEEWSANFPRAVDRILANPGIVTGSTYGISTTPNLIEACWFAPLSEKPLRFINSGHLIVHRSLYESVNGFAEYLVSGEDYDFSMRCRENGATIVDDQSLFVRHAGYPKTIKGFFVREAWHGMGDVQSIKNFLSSYVAMLSMAIVALSIYVLVAALLLHDLPSAAVAFLAICFTCFAVVLKKYGARSSKIMIVNSFLYYVYFIARAYSLKRVLFSKNTKRTRA